MNWPGIHGLVVQGSCMFARWYKKAATLGGVGVGWELERGQGLPGISSLSSPTFLVL